MRERVKALRENLAASGCDSFVSFAPPANEYLSGFRCSTSVVLVTGSEAVFLCDFRYTEQAQTHVKGFEIHEVSGGMEARTGEWLAKLGAKNTGFDATTMTVQQLDSLRAAHSGEFAAANRVVAALRERKTPEEVEALRAATALAEAAFGAVKSELKAGVMEREFAALLEHEFKRRGASGVSFSPIVLFGARSSLPHGVPGEKRLEPGDVVLLDFGCVFGSYCSDLTRTFVFGRIPAPWFEEIYATTLKAQCAALAGIRAGAHAREVDAIARDIIREASYADFFGHGLGHGVGLEVHESPRLNPQSDTVLEPGMVVTVEPGIYLPGKGGVRIEDLVVVTGEGCDVLTQLPKELEVIEA